MCPAHHGDDRSALRQSPRRPDPAERPRLLYIAQDNDPAGRHAAETLAERAHAAGVEVLPLLPALGDFKAEAQQITGAIIDIFEGMTLIERRNAFELMRDSAAERFETHTRHAWRLHTGSMVNRKALAAAMIDSRDFLAARTPAETEVMLPAGPKIAFTGGADVTDHRLIWSTLDKVAAKHPGMVLMHGGNPRGAELIASRWADNRQVAQTAFKPDWARHAKSAPFKRNDAMLDILPIGVIVFAGTGNQDNLADEARKLGIPLFDLRPNLAMGDRPQATALLLDRDAVSGHLGYRGDDKEVFASIARIASITAAGCEAWMM